MMMMSCVSISEFSYERRYQCEILFIFVFRHTQVVQFSKGSSEWSMKSKKEEMQKETNGRLYPTLKEGEEGAVETVQEGKYSDEGEGEGEYGKEGEGECTLNPS